MDRFPFVFQDGEKSLSGFATIVVNEDAGEAFANVEFENAFPLEPEVKFSNRLVGIMPPEGRFQGKAFKLYERKALNGSNRSVYYAVEATV